MLLSEKAKRVFKELIQKRGYSEKFADQLWKWYDFSDKKGVATY